jgi:DNA-binding transcriptional regulator YiaG
MEMTDVDPDDKENELPITPAQCRMARAGVQMSVRELAHLAEVSGITVTRFENGDVTCPVETILGLMMVLEARGARFLSNSAGIGVMIVDH